MAEEKPRIFQGAKDITYSLGIIVVLMLIVMGTSGLCSFNQDKKGQPVTSVDAGTFISMEVRTTSFPIRLPVTPDNWTCTVARRVQINEEFAPLIGWVTDDSNYVQVIQTSQPIEKAYDKIDSKVREYSETRSIDGHEVKIYTGDEPLWSATTPDGVDVIISGLATEQEFTQLLDATLNASPISNQ
ncbi:MAG: DUF4245 domain-containing protein [Corynebacterium sp.]|nr:DUF4245 domain-containing protein [Corynebacterium sp.]